MEAKPAPVSCTLTVKCNCGSTTIYELDQFGAYDPVKLCAVCGVCYVVACSVAYVYQKEECDGKDSP